ncbi:BREX protein BrxB domain-containing protein [Polyangium sp. 15x6]|uniref:BREX protein BrxB domain-containing protein n=1 Tax=Polyangium sp. 15x6 TaxID=3042687 RepID=UPI00249C58F4|nr:BREX protein BrxB domain-containing protein [Polyangium sp. 15x6]MDI3291590.1 DUF1788 domain-containing protein [Polyangium sp. 15x6]
MSDLLEQTFEELRQMLGSPADRLTPTHADPFFTFVFPPNQVLDLARRVRRWSNQLERDGFDVQPVSLAALAWQRINASGRWEDWREMEEPGQYRDANGSVRDVLRKEGAGIIADVACLCTEVAPRGLLLLTDAALLHPWFRVDKLGAALHDRVRRPTVLFYPGKRWGDHGLRFLGIYPDDAGSYRTTLLGGT